MITAPVFVSLFVTANHKRTIVCTHKYVHNAKPVKVWDMDEYSTFPKLTSTGGGLRLPHTPVGKKFSTNCRH